ncbi:putative polysaccharide biosynthesis protein [Salirhabdus sp. Marseille-P4669]|uniref:putative polysaccharide biosynthesis protein n=1 Tax=Salirhabdus sp. Marseille-P4669 TaxID=2042310 RepID=UPI000C79E356|nr:polysaccharide biosynthesis protein [Salirhabdus sp. Marseille-P4669]
MSNIIRGTMLLTGANYLSKLLGIIYLIPFEALVGYNAIALYTFAYTPYSILISISTMGIPLAMSKFVSKHNTMGDYRAGRVMLKSAMKVMVLTGFIAFLILFFGAESIAKLSIADYDLNNSVEDAAFVIKMVSFALLILPTMSILRGFFQGYGSMGPTAISVVMEQIVRIVFLLGSVFIIIKIMDGSTLSAVGIATFAAFVGAVGSLLVLAFYWKSRKAYLDVELQKQTVKKRHTKKQMYRELLSYAGPFVLVGIATPLYQLIDQFTIIRAMGNIGLKDISELVYAVIVSLGHKLVIIPVTIATGLSLALLPVITKSFTENKREVYIHQINLSLQTVMLIIIPAAVGLSILGTEAYASFYGVDEDLAIAGPLLSWYAPVALFFGLFTVSASILQGLNRQNFALISLGIGILIKVICNIPFIYLFEGKGAIFATGLAVLTASILNIWQIQKTTNMSLKPLYKRTLLVLIFTVIMTIVVFIVKGILNGLIFDEPSRLQSIVVVIVSAGIGGYLYLWLSYKSTLMEHVLGNKARVLSKFFP